MPKVSVIIPVFGVEKYMERCARSLFEQTLDDIEYLFIDDCTPDRSIEILKSILEEYPHRKSQVIIHRMEKNSGQAAVRKWGTLNATGDYIIHCDSDDWVDTEMYRAMYEKAIEENSDIVICDYCRTDGQSRIEYFSAFKNNLKKKRSIRAFLIGKYPWSLWNKLIKRSTYTNNDIIFPKDSMGEDRVLCMQCVFYCEKISYIPKSYYFYYINHSSITHHQRDVYSFRNNKHLYDFFLSKKGYNNFAQIYAIETYRNARRYDFQPASIQDIFPYTPTGVFAKISYQLVIGKCPLLFADYFFRVFRFIVCFLTLNKRHDCHINVNT